jgi:hypothetical protein
LIDEGVDASPVVFVVDTCGEHLAGERPSFLVRFRTQGVIHDDLPGLCGGVPPPFPQVATIAVSVGVVVETPRHPDVASCRPPLLPPMPPRAGTLRQSVQRRVDGFDAREQHLSELARGYLR